MKCGKIRELFSSYMENAMDGRLSARFEEHLAGCAECHAAYDRVNATAMMLDEIPQVDPPADFHAAVMARVEKARRAAPQRVKWWSIDWQRVFTIRVPARAAALGLATVLLAVLVIQLTPVHTGLATIFPWSAKPSVAPVANTDPDAPRQWEPWTPKSKTDAGLKLTIRMESADTYAITLGTSSDRAIAYSVSAGDDRYSGAIKANLESVVKVAAPKMGVAIAKVEWSYRGMQREESLFLPSKISRKVVSRSFALRSMSMGDLLQRLAQEYGVALIASGDLGQRVPGGSIENETPDGALYYFLTGSGLKSGALSESVYAIEPVR